MEAVTCIWQKLRDQMGDHQTLCLKIPQILSKDIMKVSTTKRISSTNLWLCINWRIPKALIFLIGIVGWYCERCHVGWSSRTICEDSCTFEGKPFIQNQFCEGARSGCNQLGAISDRRWLLELWHYRLGHLNVKDVHTLQNIVIGLNLGQKKCPMSSLLDEVYIKNKQYRVAFPNKGGRWATKPLKIVHSDVCDPIRTTSMGSARYFGTLVYDFKEGVVVCVEI